MILRSGKVLEMYFPKDTMPFRMIVLEDKIKETTKKEKEVKIDFDKATKEWRKNKKSIGFGMFRYNR
jgi:hypothetical protein